MKYPINITKAEKICMQIEANQSRITEATFEPDTYTRRRRLRNLEARGRKLKQRLSEALTPVMKL